MQVDGLMRPCLCLLLFLLFWTPVSTFRYIYVCVCSRTSRIDGVDFFVSIPLFVAPIARIYVCYDMHKHMIYFTAVCRFCCSRLSYFLLSFSLIGRSLSFFFLYDETWSYCCSTAVRMVLFVVCLFLPF